ncbi:hypothetical protein Q8A67_025006 [Cirrhinus molitorella]|uniref:Uncharacterized protein n=1 Tax=Cirrhinus molitorella TaxID=172907 RepID=A0AA88NYZ7_9TELE|nr:hypothetical protein Q8A67_025006 [Cirrhinus molitorella]
MAWISEAAHGVLLEKRLIKCKEQLLESPGEEVHYGKHSTCPCHMDLHVTGGQFAPSLSMWSKSHRAQPSTPRQTQNLKSEPTGSGPVVEREILKSGCTEICGTPEPDFGPNWTSMDTELTQDVSGGPM